MVIGMYCFEFVDEEEDRHRNRGTPLQQWEIIASKKQKQTIVIIKVYKIVENKENSLAIIKEIRCNEEEYCNIEEEE